MFDILDSVKFAYFVLVLYWIFITGFQHL